MAKVNFKELRKTAKPTYQTITVAEFGGDVTIKALNVVELTNVFQAKTDGDRMVLAVLFGVMDAKKEREFKDKEFDVIAEMDAQAIMQIGTAIIELSNGETPKNG
ncbi:hypothetical protein [Moritella viscosa]|uniref:Phage protein n=1 Tax=Moritella viscosa TaxID=80854 RepID=A0A1L0AI28_9GAMM|nr:hypothetical protein [Moritella viscosa]SGZ16450.1 Putative uncharacterized protein [Moritella viscosa]SHO02325.1 Putative uncharacterized protein [Moritella viscosa]SHO02452.1 Putative uncharacterized protein [Moritella viscosa]SHO07157.1 Putative uncharacterized protein [Moritella viscosa]SHO17777.1 Putative uncharacterized protein [Moritella viscosa]